MDRISSLRVWAVVALLLVPLPARAQAPVPPAPVTVATAFGNAMRAWMAAHGVGKGSVAVMRDDRLVYADGFGGRSASERVGVWSLSKAITATCVAALVREGRLGFDDPIGQHLQPLFRVHGAPADPRLPRVTVWQLVTHRSGFATSVGGNRFAPGLAGVLRRSESSAATSVMLMPEILKLTLAEAPGAKFQYSNVGYLLLGRLIAAVTGQDYATACARRVLAPAGIRGAALEPTWGAVTDSAAGWHLTGPEYLAFARLLRSNQLAVLDTAAQARIRTVEEHWINDEKINAYTLGVNVRPVKGASSNLFHTGGWDWRQTDAAGGAIDQNSGTLFVLAGDGIAWFAAFDRLARETEQQARRELAEAMWRARQSVTTWPATDAFATFGVGPVKADR